MSNIKKNLIYNILLQASNIFFPLITFPYISRVLGPDGLGVANFAQNFCLYFILFATLGIPIYGNREIAKNSENPERRSRIFIEISIIKLLTSILVLIPYFIIVFTVEKFSSNLTLYYWGAFYILANVTAIEWFFSGLENFRYITIRSVFVKILYVISLFLFVKDKSDVTVYFLIIIFSTFINGIINIRFALNFIQWNFGWKDLRLKEHIVPLTLLFSYFLATSMYTMLDTILLGLLSTDTAVGFYTAAIRLVKICLTLITSLGEVSVPRLTSEVAKSNFEEVKRLLNGSINFVYTFAIPLMVGLFILAPELVQIFSGEEYYPAILTLKILSLLILVIGLANIFAVQILIPMAKDKLLLYGSFLGGAISIGANFLLIPIWQQNGAAITIVLAEGTVMVFAFWFARRLLTFNLSLTRLFLHVLSVLPYFLIAYVARLVFDHPMLIVGATFIFSGLVFLLVQGLLFKNSIILNALEGVLTKVRKVRST